MDKQRYYLDIDHDTDLPIYQKVLPVSKFISTKEKIKQKNKKIDFIHKL